MSRGGFTPRARGAAARGGAQKYKEQLFNEQPKTTCIVLLLVYGCMIFSGRDYLAPPGDSSLDPPLSGSDPLVAHLFTAFRRNSGAQKMVYVVNV